MRVAHVLVSVSRKSGGLFHSVAGMAKAEAELPGMEVEVHGVEDDFSAADAPSWRPLVPQIHRAAGPGFLGWAPGMKKAVMGGNYDIVHNHGLWQDVSRVGMAWQHGSGKPHIVSPRGMLDAWALANSGWKKRVAGAVFENRHLRDATCLHALCEAEAEAMRAYGLKNPIAVVPNGVALPAQRCDEWRVTGDESARLKTLLFLGRLHPKKGLPEALRAWAEVTRGRKTGWRFVIAGWDQGGHEAELKRICSEIGVPLAEIPVAALAENGKLNTEHSPVVFFGPAFGETKDSLLRSADAFILPSLSEGLPMSVLEAWAYELPVVMTEECNLPEGFAAGAAIKIAAKSEGLRVAGEEGGRGSVSVLRSTSASVALRELMGMTAEERRTMGARGRALVEERFTWPKVAAQMKEVYQWVLGTGPRPKCVQG